jgi:hypothetical protein
LRRSRISQFEKLNAGAETTKFQHPVCFSGARKIDDIFTGGGKTLAIDLAVPL